ncbi:MAG: TolC family protein [Chitinophagales bacterium]|nr:TolC family protein [Chitinophagales bacterium]
MTKLKNIKNIAVILFLFLNINIVSAQNTVLYLDSCYAMANRNYPLISQFNLLEKSKEYSIDNANKGYLPQLGIYGQATYQSEVTQVQIPLPNVDIPKISKDQYKLYGEVVQPITDLFNLKNQKEVIKANYQVEEQKIEVELYKLHERINNLFFGILLIDAQNEQVNLLIKDIKVGINKLNAAIENGVAVQSDADNLKAELLKANQKIIELDVNRKAFTQMLSHFIGTEITESTELVKPQFQINTNEINRPELLMFEMQEKTFDAQKKLINAKVLPYFNLFFQGGVGRPALNMLSNDLDGYYITGLRLNWRISNFYTFKKEKKIVDLNKQGVDIQRQMFLFNTNLLLQQQNSEIDKYLQLINTDNDIISLKENVKNTTKNQLEYGTATSNDYVTAVNAQNQAQQNLALHKIQLLMAQYNYKTTLGN